MLPWRGEYGATESIIHGAGRRAKPLTLIFLRDWKIRVIGLLAFFPLISFLFFADGNAPERRHALGA